MRLGEEGGAGWAETNESQIGSHAETPLAWEVLGLQTPSA